MISVLPCEPHGSCFLVQDNFFRTERQIIGIAIWWPRIRGESDPRSPWPLYSCRMNCNCSVHSTHYTDAKPQQSIVHPSWKHFDYCFLSLPLQLDPKGSNYRCS